MYYLPQDLGYCLELWLLPYPDQRSLFLTTPASPEPLFITWVCVSLTEAKFCNGPRAPSRASALKEPLTLWRSLESPSQLPSQLLPTYLMLGAALWAPRIPGREERERPSCTFGSLLPSQGTWDPPFNLQAWVTYSWRGEVLHKWLPRFFCAWK